MDFPSAKQEFTKWSDLCKKAMYFSFYGILYLIMVIPVGIYVYHIAAGKHTFADPVFDRVDGVIYKISGIRQQNGMDWKQYALALIGTNGVMILLGYLILRIQGVGLFNPNGIKGMEPSLSFNTIISFMNQYKPSALFRRVWAFLPVSDAGHHLYDVCFRRQRLCSLYRVYPRAGRKKRRTCRQLFCGYCPHHDSCPFSIFRHRRAATGLAGCSPEFSTNMVTDTLEGAKQIIAMGPVAALEIIKHLGTNGGGFLGANSATPIENPTILSNLIELYSMMLLPGACVVTFGKMVRDRKRDAAAGSLAAQQSLSSRGKPRRSLTVWLYGREGRSIFAAMGILFLIGLGVCFWAESQGNPALAGVGLNQSMASMEGKEVRFGIAQSAMFTTTTTSFTTGTVNNMHGTLTPLGGMVPLLHMMLNVVFGGKGDGLMNMIMYAILAVFLCGLMIGRTPEYLGKKIEGREMKLTALCIIIHPLLILVFSALAVGTQAGMESITNPGFQGLSQVLYEYFSAAANNGSGFEGLADNTVFWNITTGLVMFFGRYLSIVIQLAIAGSLMKKRFVNESAGTLHTDTPMCSAGCRVRGNIPRYRLEKKNAGF